MNSGIIGKRVEYKDYMDNLSQGIVMCLCEDNKWFLICDDQLMLHIVRYNKLQRIVLDIRFEEAEKGKTEE